MQPLQGKTVVLGVCGSISSYKAADLASKLVQAGAQVDVILTAAAREFLTPLTFHSLTGRAVSGDMFSETETQEAHVHLARAADLVIIAPATATTMARLAQGLADEMLSLTVLATTAPVLIAPAMDAQMWAADATQENIQTLRRRGVAFVGPMEGRLASGHVGLGRLAEPEDIVGAAKHLLGANGDLAGTHVVVSAGGTRENIDPVRFISNASSGKMGYSLAEAARDRGARVTLVSTIDTLPVPYGVERVPVASVAQMREAVLSATADAQVLVMAAAMSDFRPADVGAQKIKRSEGGLVLTLVENEDFFHEVPDRVVKVAFAAETQDVIANARRKPLSHGHLDLICANDVSEEGSGFGTDTNRVSLIDAAGAVTDLPLLPKYEVAERIWDAVAGILKARGT